jgi:hypothetical protein
MEIVCSMKGRGALLEVYEDKVAITPKGVTGFLLKGLKGTKVIPFYSITAIQFKKSGLTAGYLQFTVPGGVESKGGVFTAASDENTFMFIGQNEVALGIKDYIEKKMQESHNTSATSAGNSISDELQKLSDLKVKGILSEEEFQAAKKRLLSG